MKPSFSVYSRPSVARLYSLELYELRLILKVTEYQWKNNVFISRQLAIETHGDIVDGNDRRAG